MKESANEVTLLEFVFIHRAFLIRYDIDPVDQPMYLMRGPSLFPGKLFCHETEVSGSSD